MRELNDIKISHLGIGDVPAIMGVMSTAFDAEFGEAWTVEQCRATLLLPGTHLIAAQTNRDVAGFALFMTVMDNSELLLLAVGEQVRQAGLGTRLMTAWENQAYSEGVSRLFLEVREGNSAFDFYTRCGFVPIGRRRAYYTNANGSKSDAITMAKDRP